MDINGIARLVYGVTDLDRSAAFFTDLGLTASESGADGTVLTLDEGSAIEVRRGDDPALPEPFLDGDGPRELVWGVPDREQLEQVRAELSRDRTVTVADDGSLHTRDDAGMAIGFEVFERRQPEMDGSPENSPSNIRRFNARRRWYERAEPKMLFHAVFGMPRAVENVAFYTGRLGFRVTDVLRGKGAFLRAPGRFEHHNLFVLKTPRPLFSHVSFGVESVDELMVGANHMQRSGWSATSEIGRHRVSSMIFSYVPCPAGGRVEYSADGDYVDDSWRPSVWSEPFAHVYWDSHLPEGSAAPARDIEPLDGPVERYIEAKRGAR
ncbi:VOC family protein [Actinomadura graeca]|uniref:VOC family protein n=1 Tax=Actinomadura graeca TaxID=2750812 RepID=A0ABX8R0P9_9ACTN|nr:VOC family protein [Actinomadura graeca]QXJ23844.1 VOC family protein [Actinomadura graeca]